MVGGNLNQVKEINKYYLKHATIKLKSYDLRETQRLDSQKYTLAKFLERDDRATINRRTGF